jgi:hypothetical protein
MLAFSLFHAAQRHPEATIDRVQISSLDSAHACDSMTAAAPPIKMAIIN